MLALVAASVLGASSTFQCALVRDGQETLESFRVAPHERPVVRTFLEQDLENGTVDRHMVRCDTHACAFMFSHSSEGDGGAASSIRIVDQGAIDASETPALRLSYTHAGAGGDYELVCTSATR